MAEPTAEQKADMNARFQKAGQQVADALNKAHAAPAAPAPAQEQKPPVEPAKKETPRAEDGKFAPKQPDENLPKLRDALARAVKERDAERSSTAALTTEVQRLQALVEKALTPKAPADPYADLTPEEIADRRRSRGWVEREIKPLLDPITDQLRSITEERRIRDERAANERAFINDFRKGVEIMGLTEEQEMRILQKVAREGTQGQTGMEAFMLAFKELGVPGQTEAKAEREAADQTAAAKAATGIMGRHEAGAPPSTQDTFNRDLAEARKDKSPAGVRRVNDLLVSRFAGMQREFQAFHGLSPRP